jgi:Superinfection immunity protein
MTTIIILGIVLGVYFAPTGIAVYSEKKNWGAILALNLLLGWTLLGWVGALIWSVMKD